MDREYKIEPVKTSKDAIKHPKLSEEGVIPRLCSSCILVGKSGSSKSVLLQNLMTRKEFFAGHFGKVFLVSPTAEADDVQLALSQPELRVYGHGRSHQSLGQNRKIPRKRN